MESSSTRGEQLPLDIVWTVWEPLVWPLLIKSFPWHPRGQISSKIHWHDTKTFLPSGEPDCALLNKFWILALGVGVGISSLRACSFWR